MPVLSAKLFPNDELKWRRRHLLVCVTALLSVAAAAAIVPSVQSATITYMGVIQDRNDFARLNIGNAGYWFPQFNAASPVAGRPTGENVRDVLPSWAGPLNHVTSFLDPTYSTRTFSQDGPARSKGGQTTWNAFRLPNGEAGLSGAIVDPFTAGNSNNTINRIQLNAGVPSTFYFHVITDNTNLEHDPTNRLRARGSAGETFPGAGNGVDIDPNTFPTTAGLHFNGIADVYTFRYDGFAAGDFIKLQLNGAAGGQGASFGGFLFDVTFEPDLSLPTAGDYNQDNLVDASDYVIWRRTLNNSGYFLQADGHPDNRIDEQDYFVWSSHFGSSGDEPGGTASQAGAVPEPSAIVLVLIAPMLSCRRRRDFRTFEQAKHPEWQ